MRKWYFLLLVLHIIVIPVSRSQSIAGNENVQDKARNVEDFNSVIVDGGITVFLIPGDTAEILVRADENLDSIIATEVENGTLRVYPSMYIRYFNTMEIYITYVDLKSLSAMEYSVIKADSLLNLKELAISVDQGSNLNLDINAELLNCKLSRASNAQINGIVKDVTLEINEKSKITMDLQAGNLQCNVNKNSKAILKGICQNSTYNAIDGSNIYAIDLKTENCKIKLELGSDAEVYATQNLKISADDGSDVVYSGNPIKKEIDICEDCEVIAQ